MKLCLIRHPRPAVPVGLCYGRTDVPVDETHLLELLEHLPPRLPRDAALYSSPLTRCLRLARGLERLGCSEPTTDARLREMDFGHWEGRLWTGLPREELDAWRADIVRTTPPGGESVGALAERGHSFCRTLPPGRDAIVVTHAGVMQTLLRSLQGLPLASFGGRRIDYGELVVLERTPDGWALATDDRSAD